MKASELQEILISQYHVDTDEVADMDESELQSMLDEFHDHSDLFPNEDEFDGSHEWD